MRSFLNVELSRTRVPRDLLSLVFFREPNLSTPFELCTKAGKNLAILLRYFTCTHFRMWPIARKLFLAAARSSVPRYGPQQGHS